MCVDFRLISFNFITKLGIQPFKSQERLETRLRILSNFICAMAVELLRFFEWIPHEYLQTI